MLLQANKQVVTAIAILQKYGLIKDGRILDI